MSPLPDHQCVDCAKLPPLPDDESLANEDVEYRPRTPRPAPYGGPRSRQCSTHRHARRKATRARRHDALVSRTYHLARGEYAELLAFQGGVCAICRVATGRAKRLAVDHDHNTDEPRGILCGRCNLELLGRYPREALLRALAYLDDPPLRRMRRGAS